jgi:thymidylate synthase (FAD)
MVLTRTTVPEVDAILGVPAPVLDFGQIAIMSYMGSDQDIARAARTSYGDGTKTLREDEGLIRYLISHQHTSPLEFVETVWFIKCPIFVARQIVRHRTASMSEVSARYSILPEESYVPDAERVGGQDKVNRQGTGTALDPADQDHACTVLAGIAADAQDAYEELLGLGVSRETARGALTVSRYTQFYWKIDLKNLLHFLHLRTDPHAQYEVRVFAEAMEQIVAKLVPQTYAAWCEFVRDAVTFSSLELRVLRAGIESPDVELETMAHAVGLTGREWREFRDKLVVLK